MAMCRSFTIVVFVTLCVYLGAATAYPQSSTQPVVHFPPLPPSLPELAHTVDVVVLGRMTKSSGPQVQIDGLNRESVRRNQHVEVLEVLKGALQGQATHVVVRQAGGTIKVAGRQVSEQIIQRLLEPGDLTVLFLRRVDDKTNIYYIAYGPSGAIRVNPDSTAEIPPAMQSMPEMRGRNRVPLEELLTLFRGTGE